MSRLTFALAFCAGLLAAQLAQAAPGDLDPTFGVGGKVIGPLFTSPGGPSIRDGVIQPDGRIVFVGDGFIAGVATITVVRLEADGALDTSFGSGGVVTVPVGGSGYDIARAVALQPDGRILVAGGVDATPGSLTTGDAVVLRLLADGSLDASFGNGGVVQTSFGSQFDIAYGVDRQPNGKIVIAGESEVGTSQHFALARYEDDGSPDLTFGTAGQVVTVVSSNDYILDMALQPDGKIVVGGASRPSATHATVARYNPDGTLDGGFGTGGVTVAAVTSSSGIIDLALQPDGKIVASGGGASPMGYVALALRLDANGTLDPTFGTGGAVITNASQAQSLQGVIVQPNGKIVTAGWRYDFSGPNEDFLLLGLDAGGGFDPGFGTGGIVITDMGGSRDAVTTLVRQVDGRLVAMGIAVNGGRLALARYEGTLAACGNGVTEPPESCDDGNVTPADGCDPSCAVETGFACIGMPSVCTPGCGDGTIGGSEACDDGGVAAGDGCDATCQLDPGWTCTGEPTSCASVCGDSRLVGGEACDDGNTNDGDCCAATCQFESAGGPCLDEGDVCTSDTCGAGAVCQHTFVLELCPVCGDGLVMGDEECDDDNTTSGDCCDASCQLEPVGQPCVDDGDLCSNDTCGAGGVCQHEVAPDPACLLPTEPGKAQLKIVDATKDQVQFKWMKGPAVPKANFGTPSIGVPQYALCLYDQVGGSPTAAMNATASGDADCSDGTCWRESRRGWRLKNVVGAPSGIVALTLQEGLVDGKSKVQVKMKGPYLLTPSLPLASDPSIVVQVRSSDDQCFGAVFSTPTRNDGVTYRAKSD